jgi:pimeloyl-ACP methyl ester carboxylesterase
MNYVKTFFCFLLILTYNLKAQELPLKKIVLKDYEIEYYFGGNKKPYFLLIHGLGVDKQSFYQFAKILAFKYHYKILLPDIPGQGTTKRIYEKTYSIENIADDLFQFLQILKIKKVILVGNSMGGHIAAVFALKYPINVDKLILINPSGIEYQDKKPYQLLSEDLIKNEKNPKVIEDFNWYNKIRSDIQQDKYYILNSMLNQLKIPTILFWGRDDNIIPYQYSSIWASEIPHIHFFVLKGGHLLQKEVPEEIIQRIFSTCRN